MTQLNSIEPYDPEAVEDYRQQSRAFLGRAREYLAAEDLHQGSEKGWGAAAWMAKAVAVRHGWQYETHAQFGVVLRNASDLTGSDRIVELADTAYGLHRSYYTRKMFLSTRTISHSLDRMAELLDALEPLTEPANGQASD